MRGTLFQKTTTTAKKAGASPGAGTINQRSHNFVFPELGDNEDRTRHVFTNKREQGTHVTCSVLRAALWCRTLIC